MRFLEEQLVALDVTAASPEEAIRKAGLLLQKVGAVEACYPDAMVASYRKNGAYFVLAPGIAIPHARPEDGGIEASIALVRLKEPIVFGHEANDPVRLVFALGASSGDEHLLVLQKLTEFLGNTSNVDRLLKAKRYEDVQQIVGGDAL